MGRIRFRSGNQWDHSLNANPFLNPLYNLIKKVIVYFIIYINLYRLTISGVVPMFKLMHLYIASLMLKIVKKLNIVSKMYESWNIYANFIFV